MTTTAKKSSSTSQQAYIDAGVKVFPPGKLETIFRWVLPQFVKFDVSQLKSGVHYFTTLKLLRTKYQDSSQIRKIDCSGPEFALVTIPVESMDSTVRPKRVVRKNIRFDGTVSESDETSSDDFDDETGITTSIVMQQLNGKPEKSKKPKARGKDNIKTNAKSLQRNTTAGSSTAGLSSHRSDSHNKNDSNQESNVHESAESDDSDEARIYSVSDFECPCCEAGVESLDEVHHCETPHHQSQSHFIICGAFNQCEMFGGGSEPSPAPLVPTNGGHQCTSCLKQCHAMCGIRASDSMNVSLKKKKCLYSKMLARLCLTTSP